MDDYSVSESADIDEEQTGEGLSLLRNTCDFAEGGYHDEAWDSLHKARMLR